MNVIYKNSLAKSLVATALITSMIAPAFAEGLNGDVNVDHARLSRSVSTMDIHTGFGASYDADEDVNPLARSLSALDSLKAAISVDHYDDEAEPLAPYPIADIDQDEDDADVGAEVANPDANADEQEDAANAQAHSWKQAAKDAAGKAWALIPAGGPALLKVAGAGFAGDIVLALVAPQLAVGARAAAVLAAGNMVPEGMRAVGRVLGLNGIARGIVGNVAAGEALRQAPVIANLVQWATLNYLTTPEAQKADTVAKKAAPKGIVSGYVLPALKTTGKAVFARALTNFGIGVFVPSIANFVGARAAAATTAILPDWTKYIGAHWVLGGTASLIAKGKVFRLTQVAAPLMDQVAIPATKLMAKGAKVAADYTVVPAANRTVVPAAKYLKEKVVQAATAAKAKIKTALDTAKTAIATKAGDLLRKVQQGLENTRFRLKNAAQNAATKVGGWFRSAKKWFSNRAEPQAAAA